MGMQVVQFVRTGISFALNLFADLLDATGLTTYYLSTVAFALVVGYLLGGFIVPISGASDMASSAPPGKSDKSAHHASNVRGLTRNKSGSSLNSNGGKSNDRNS